MRISWATLKPENSFIPRLKERVSRRSLKIARAVWQGAVDRTQVSSGELRASWNLSIGQPNYVTVGKSDSSPGPSSGTLPPPSMPNIQAAPLSLAKYYVSNGKAYARYQEFGSPTNSPRLMLTRAVKAVDV